MKASHFMTMSVNKTENKLGNIRIPREILYFLRFCSAYQINDCLQRVKK